MLATLKCISSQSPDIDQAKYIADFHCIQVDIHRSFTPSPLHVLHEIPVRLRATSHCLTDTRHRLNLRHRKPPRHPPKD